MVVLWNPQKCSPVHHKMIERGASLVSVSGWHLAEHFGDPDQEAIRVRSNVGLSDLSSLPKWEIKGNELSKWAGIIFADDIPEPGCIARTDSGYVSRVSRNHAFFILNKTDIPVPAPLRSENFPAGCLHVLDRTDGFGGFLLCGPKANAILRRLTSLDLREATFPNLSCAFGPMAAIRVLLVRKDRAGLPAYEIFFSREYGEYFWDAVLAAGKEFQLVPFGSLAEHRLES